MQEGGQGISLAVFEENEQWLSSKESTDRQLDLELAKFSLLMKLLPEVRESESNGGERIQNCHDLMRSRNFLLRALA